MFWFLCAALAALVVAAVLAPFWRERGAAAEPSAAYDLRVYRDQLREVEQDLERGVIGADDAARLRVEIGRKVLDADRRLAEAGAVQRRGGVRLAAAVMAVILAGTVALYWREGAPGLRDLPLGERLAAAQQVYDSRPTQAEAEAAAPPVPVPAPDGDFAALMERLRDTVAKNPDDLQGLTLLARNEARLGDLAAAREAQERLVAVKGDAATAEDLTQLAALMVQQAGGLITPQAEAVLARAIARDPRHPQARYMVGLLHAQNGRPDRTFSIWARLLEEGPPDAPWLGPIRQAIPDLAWLAGQPNYTPPDPPGGMPALPGPDSGAVAAAEDMAPEDRRQMIEGMVAQLESRLSSEGGSPEEWARLIASLGVLGHTDHARTIWGEAQARFGDQADAIAPIRAAAVEAGIAE